MQVETVRTICSSDGWLREAGNGDAAWGYQ